MDAVFKALADPTRRLILDELSERDRQTFFELCARLIMKHDVRMSRQAVAKHIAVLEHAGLVISEQNGRYKVLTFNSAPIAAMNQRWLKISDK
jgi:DNA-binding transcriptional ArsR family regulator